ncbi:hypothetical protein HK104_001661 [Borealophlyctis nickersoniae]|nr:hypothetical protein HK104_001661 [Borealophlyctis nickersoniae]
MQSRLASFVVLAIASLLALAALPAYGKPVGGVQTLVILDSLKAKDSYSKFLKGLEERGHQLTFQTPSDELTLVRYEEPAFDHLLVLAPKIQKFGGELGVGAVLDFINKGGNVLVAATSDMSEAIRDLSVEFSVDFDDSDTAVIDHFLASDDDHTLVAASNFAENDIAVPKSVKEGGPVLFRGVGHKLSGKNPLIRPLLVGAPTTYSYEPHDVGTVAGNSFIGSNVVLVSALQARNNARVVFAGSLEMFSDKLMDAPVKVAGRDRYPKSGNEAFVSEVSAWVFQEKGVLRVRRVKHHRENETAQHGIYRIKDDMVYSIEVAEWHLNAWRPYRATDMQFEAVMLDPYIRKTMTPLPGSPDAKSGKFITNFKLPDKYGVFTFKVEYKRHGYTWLTESETVQVRPYRHDQYPRFIGAAYPYYANAFSMMVAFFVFSAVFLYNQEPSASPQQKVKTT